MNTTTTRQARAAQIQEERDRRAAKNTAWMKQARPERFERQTVPQHGDIIQTSTGQYRYSDYTPAQQPATPIQNAPGPNNQPIGADVRQPIQKQTYIIRDTLGREQEISEEQRAQLERQQKNRKSSENWTILPEEVANSGADWWVNNLGLFEWTPQTEGDKQHLEKINKQRAQFGKAPTLTLTTGAAWSDEFREEWYSTGGKRTVASKGSGGEKLDKLRGSSTINTSATATTGTAQDAKARIIKLEPPKPAKELQPAPKSTAPKIQIENPFAGSEPGWSIKTNDPIADQVAKALQEAKKANPQGSEEYFEGVANVARRKQMTPREVLKEDLTHAGAQISKAAAPIFDFAEKGKSKLGALDKQASKAASPIFDLAEKVKSKYDAALEGVSLSFTDKGKISISKKGTEKPTAGFTVSAKTAHDQFIEGTGVLKGADTFLDAEYNKLKEKPVSAGIEYGAYYAGGAALGAATKGAKLITSPLGKKAAEKVSKVSIAAIEKTSSPLIKQSTAKIGGKVAGALETGSYIDTAMIGALGAETIRTGAEGYIEGGAAGATKNLLDTGKALAIGAPGFKAGDKFAGRIAQGDYIAAVPILKSAKISELAGSGANQTPVDLSYGTTIAPLGKPILTHVPGQGFKIGAAGAPKEAITGKTTQAFSKLETKFFEKTIQETASPTEAEYLQSALNIGKEVTKARAPPTASKEFEITSKGIPEPIRPAIKEALISYKGDLTVAGSVPMKAQADPFVSRTPHDLELYTDNHLSTISHISKTLEAKGFKEGTDYKASDGKIEFKHKTEGGEIWDTGIEAFSHGKEKPQSTRAIEEALYGLKKDTSPESPQSRSKIDGSEIAFGYGSRKPVETEGGKIKIQDLREQMTRKIAGSTQYREGLLQPAHPGRVKDIGDVITTGTAYAVKSKAPIEKDLISFTETAFQKFGSGKSEMSKAFQEKVATDPVVKFIHENKKLPSEKELIGMQKNAPEILETEIFFQKGNTRRQSPSPLLRSPSPSPLLRSPSPSPLLRSQSPSPLLRSPSPSPLLRSPSPSPLLRSQSPSPLPRSQSPSPFPRSQSPSPLLRSPSPSPFPRSPSPSPLPRSPSPSPFPRSPSPSPLPRSQSPSPFPRSPSPSPLLRSPSPSPFPRSQSPSPFTNRKRIKEGAPFLLPSFPGAPKQKTPHGDKWGARTKQHFVIDPESFVLGKTKR